MEDRTDPDRWIPVHDSMEGVIVKHVKKTLAGIGLVVAVAAVGCQKKGATQAGAGVMDISSPSASSYPTPAPQPVAQPVVYDTTAATPVSSTPTPEPGSSYVVKKGDTLYGIAKNRYGDGKQWQKIAAANPGLNPGTLKAGQTINLP